MASDPNTKPEDIERYMQQIAFNKKKENGAKEFEKVSDQGILHDLHKANAGKVVFSNQEIGKSETSSSILKTTFPSLNSGVYGRIYLTQSVRNSLADLGAAGTAGGAYVIQYYMDGKLVESAYNNPLDEEATNTWTTWQIVPAPAPSDDYAYGNMVTGFAETLKSTAPGKHKVKVVVICEYPDPFDLNKDLPLELASGEFELTFTQAEKDAFYKRFEYKVDLDAVYERQQSKSSGSSGSSSGIDEYGNIKFTIKNTTSNTIQGKIVDPGGNGSRTFSYNGNSSNSASGKVGGTIEINGKTYRTLSAGDNNGTIELK